MEDLSFKKLNPLVSHCISPFHHPRVLFIGGFIFFNRVCFFNSIGFFNRGYFFNTGIYFPFLICWSDE